MKKILIANRGEIAIRVIKTCKAMGIKTVAVYSEAERNALHVRMADEAYLLGPAPSSESYLKGDKIIEICKSHQVDAIHPGYGFLSENADFARKVKDAGIIFIGPTAESMDIMGSKLAAKQAVLTYNVPMVPGVNEAITDIEKAKKTAIEIGFPILIKASAGGGGKGMRVVNQVSEFEEQMNLAVSEAISSFGNGAVFIEKYVSNPRHIEIQIMADNFGNYTYLFERECSIQRRHQKLIEEAPSFLLTEKWREAMGIAAINVAKACNYTGAGTVEFLADNDGNFYFLEMNTRLQVEHPVTELITGIDLVKEQINVANNKPLSFTQNDLKIKGHAIELRICTEDPFDNFMPSIGVLEKYSKPIGENIRIDDCMEQGMEIPIFYDNMIAKLIVWGETRSAAIDLLKTAINDFEIEGVQTTLPFGSFVLNHPKFIDGDIDTHFINKYFNTESIAALNKTDEELAALFSIFYLEQQNNILNIPKMGSKKAWSLRRKQ